MSKNAFKTLLPQAAARALEDLFFVTRSSTLFIGVCFVSAFIVSALCQPLLTGVMDSQNIIGILIITLAELLMGFAFLLVLPARINEYRHRRPLSGATKLMKKYGNDMAAEMLRVAAGILRGILMLIVPGIVRNIRWIFVPFIVSTDDQYARGQRDALKYSEELSRGLLWLLGIIWIVFVLGDLALSQLDQQWWKMQYADTGLAWTGSLIINFVTLLLSLYSTLLNYALYDFRKSQTGEN